MSTIADYAGRLSDVSAFVRLQAGSQILLAQSLFGGRAGGFVCTGIQKLAQRYLLKMLNKAGSVFWDPGDGTNFMLDAQQGKWQTVADVMQSFYSANLDAGRQLQAEELEGDPDDERFASAELLEVTLGDGAVSIRVSLRSRAGTAYDFVTPLPVVPR